MAVSKNQGGRTMPHLTGDSLSMSILLWGISATPFSLMVLDIRDRRWRWAASFGAVGLAFVVLGFTWQALVGLVNNPPPIDQDEVFQSGFVMVAALYAILLRPKGSRILSSHTGSGFIEGLSIVPLLTLIAAPFYPAAALYMLAHDAPVFAGSAFLAVVTLLGRAIERATHGPGAETQTGEESPTS